MRYQPEDDLSASYAGSLIADYLLTKTRPTSREVVGHRTFAVQTRPEGVALSYERVRGSDYLVSRFEPFVAFGGDLRFDVIFVVGFDGVQSPLVDARFLVRPDRPEPVTATRLRTIPLDALVQAAVLQERAVFREIAPGELRAVSDRERQDVYVAAVTGNRFAARRRISDDELSRVAEVYRLAVARRQYPTQAVQRELRLPTSNVARKWVQSARKAGFLEPAPGERRGGLLP